MAAAAAEALAIGIDLGTYSSRAWALRDDGRVEIILNYDLVQEGEEGATPSVVAFTRAGRVLVGNPADVQVFENPANTIYNVMRFIGRKFEDPLVQEEMKQWPFKVVDEGGKPKFSVEERRGRDLTQKTLFPEEILSLLLAKMKESMEGALGMRVTEVVVTVPAFFNSSQRQAVRDAAGVAGLTVDRFVNGSTLAALGYTFQEGYPYGGSWRDILVVQIGGGGTDVSTFKYRRGGGLHISSTAFDHFGGEDFTDRMVDHFVKDFMREHQKNIRSNKEALVRLRSACVLAKPTLSSSTKASIEIEDLLEGIDYRTSITRARFEQLNDDLFQRVIRLVEKCIRESCLQKSQIDDILLAGGSSAIPKIRQLLRDFFNGKELAELMGVYAGDDDAGATRLVLMLNPDESREIDDRRCRLDLTPYSLGIELYPGIMTTFIPRNIRFPVRETKTLNTIFRNHLRVFEGESVLVVDNNLLGKLDLTPCLGDPSRVPKIEVTFDIDGHGIVDVTATDKSNGNRIRLTPDDQNNVGRAGWFARSLDWVTSPISEYLVRTLLMES